MPEGHSVRARWVGGSFCFSMSISSVLSHVSRRNYKTLEDSLMNRTFLGRRCCFALFCLISRFAVIKWGAEIAVAAGTFAYFHWEPY